MKLIYYVLYKWSSGDSKWNNPELTAMYLLGVILTLNVIAFYEHFRVLVGFAPRLLGENKVPYFLLGIVIVCLIYLLMVRNGKYNAIVMKFEQKENFNQSKSKAVTISYIVFTILFFFSLGLNKI